MTTTELITARARIRAVVADALELHNEVRLTDLAKQITSALRADPVFLERFIDEVLPSAVYDEVQRYVKRSRRLERTGDYAATAEVMEARRERFASRFASWYEHAGERSIKLLEMTREDLLLAAEARRKRGLTELKIALLWDKLADGLEGGQTVGERFTTEEIEERYSELEGAEHG